MRFSIIIGGIEYVRDSSLKVREAVTFCGAGHIRASAIKRDSKNRYKVTVISDRYVWVQLCATMTEAVKYLREQYSEFGTLLAE